SYVTRSISDVAIEQSEGSLQNLPDTDIRSCRMARCLDRPARGLERSTGRDHLRSAERTELPNVG
ncbi:hypothetical protein AB0L82_41140, partial [Nocardia sp. NPDC052001]|uniref:hypothetical protein n=1 Tax=Nocardia sp. NPDC052001 TaxID=3154853 RepID=UPI003437DD08